MKLFVRPVLTMSRKAGVRLLSFLLWSVILSVSGCMYPDAAIAESTGAGKTLSRSQVISRLRISILQNIQQCPEQEGTGLYTLEEYLTREVRYSFYTKESTENCQIMILAAPCMGAQINDTLFKTKYYLYILRSCGLRQVSF
jgi:hypothetical protein